MLQSLTSAVTLSDDQARAADACIQSLEEGKETILTGAAGTGKTTLTRHIIDRMGRNTVIGCPTGKAAQRAKQVTGVKATTIHKLLYKSVDEVNGQLLFSDPQKPCSKRDLLIIDEASMLGSKLYMELMAWLPEGTPVLFVGDHEQLPPVRDTWGPDLQNPTASLTQVHRQAQDNPIISFATAVRMGKWKEWLHLWDGNSDAIRLINGAPEAIRWQVERRKQGIDSALITFTHDVRRWANHSVRLAMGHAQQPEAIVPGDRLLVKTNRPRIGIMNGEQLNVTAVGSMRRAEYLKVFTRERLKDLVVNTDLIEKSPSEFWKFQKRLPNKVRFGMPFAHVWWGDCITTHSSQGSSWPEIGFLWGHQLRNRMRSGKEKDREFARRMLYTAVTRAEEKLTIFAL